MSSVILPQASAGAALFDRAVLGPLNDASRLVPPRGTFPGRLRVPMSTMRHWGICSGGVAIFLRGNAQRGISTRSQLLGPQWGVAIPTAPPLNSRRGVPV
jgi:hypothetical protein